MARSRLRVLARLPRAALFALALLGLPLGVAGAEPADLHPPVALREAGGELVTAPASDDGSPSLPDAEVLGRVDVARSCGECHDVGYIHTHNSHADVQGVLPEGGNLRCLVCHVAPPEGVEPPAERAALQSWLLSEVLGDAPPAAAPDEGARAALVLDGVVRAPSSASCLLCHEELRVAWDPRPLAQTELNFEGKASYGASADVHAGSGLGCTDCHAPRNHPTRVALTDRDDPSHLAHDPRGVRIGAYLHRPDHRLAFGRGTGDVCSQCHRTDHHERVLPRASRHLEQLACQACHVPFVIGDAAAAPDGFSHSLRRPVLARSVLLGGKLAPFLRQGDELLPVAHGVQAGERALRDCSECHDPGSRIAGPEQERRLLALVGAEALLTAGGKGGQLAADARPVELYVFGRDSVPLVDAIGLIAVLGVLGLALVHGGARVWLNWRAPSPRRARVGRRYMYGIYERFWHWLQAMVILALLLTGLELHLPRTLPLFGFELASALHQSMGIVLALNAFFSLFYHLASGDIRQFLPEPRGFFSQAVAQQLYYVRGIFRREPHPFDKDRERKLNPMQKVAYLLLLNVLLPSQVVTGVAMLFPDSGAIEWLGGLSLLAAVHGLGSWLLAAFLLLHLYLTTTGETPLTLLKAMITGFEDHHETRAPEPTAARRAKSESSAGDPSDA